MSNLTYVGRRAVTQTQNRNVKKMEIAVEDWDKMFNESSSSEEEQPVVEPEPVIVAEPEPPKITIRSTASPRDRDKFIPIRGRKETRLAQEKLSENAEKTGPTHISSDDLHNRRPNQMWDASYRAGQFVNAKAISSSDLFEEKEDVLQQLTRNLRLIGNTVKEALGDNID